MEDHQDLNFQRNRCLRGENVSVGGAVVDGLEAPLNLHNGPDPNQNSTQQKNPYQHIFAPHEACSPGLQSIHYDHNQNLYAGYPHGYIQPEQAHYVQNQNYHDENQPIYNQPQQDHQYFNAYPPQINAQIVEQYATDEDIYAEFMISPEEVRRQEEEQKRAEEEARLAAEEKKRLEEEEKARQSELLKQEEERKQEIQWWEAHKNAERHLENAQKEDKEFLRGNPFMGVVESDNFAVYDIASREPRYTSVEPKYVPSRFTYIEFLEGMPLHWASLLPDEWFEDEVVVPLPMTEFEREEAELQKKYNEWMIKQEKRKAKAASKAKQQKAKSQKLKPQKRAVSPRHISPVKVSPVKVSPVKVPSPKKAPSPKKMEVIDLSPAKPVVMKKAATKKPIKPEVAQKSRKRGRAVKTEPSGNLNMGNIHAYLNSIAPVDQVEKECEELMMPPIKKRAM